MAPEVRSTDVERRLDAYAVATEATRVQLEQHTADLCDIKKTMSRIESCLQNLTKTIRNFVPSAIAPSGLLSKTADEVVEAKDKAAISTSFAPAVEAAPVVSIPSPSTPNLAPAIARPFPPPAKVVFDVPGETVAITVRCNSHQHEQKGIWNYNFPSTMTSTSSNLSGTTPLDLPATPNANFTIKTISVELDEASYLMIKQHRLRGFLDGSARVPSPKVRRTTGAEIDNPEYRTYEAPNSAFAFWLLFYGKWDEKKTRLIACHPHTKRIVVNCNTPQEIEKNKEIIFTYDVEFQASDVKWASSWDTYLLRADDQFIWFSSIKSLIIVLFPSDMVALLILRTLSRDISKYNELETQEEAQEEMVWKLVHGDVFRHPNHSDLLCVYVGTGIRQVCYWSNCPGLSILPPEPLYAKFSNRPGTTQQLHYISPFLGTDMFKGFCIDIFMEAINLLPYAVLYHLIPFGDGCKNPNYDELVRLITTEFLDGAFGAIAIVTNLTKVVDLTQPYAESIFVMVAPFKKTNSGGWSFLRPFTPLVWIITASFFFFIGRVAWIPEHRINDEFRGTPRQQIITILWFSLSTFFLAHRENTISTLGRMVVIIWLFVVLIINSNYTAHLTSIFVVQQLSSPINGIDSLKAGDEPMGSKWGHSQNIIWLMILGYPDPGLLPLDLLNNMP